MYVYVYVYVCIRVCICTCESQTGREVEKQEGEPHQLKCDWPCMSLQKFPMESTQQPHHFLIILATHVGFSRF